MLGNCLILGRNYLLEIQKSNFGWRFRTLYQPYWLLKMTGSLMKLFINTCIIICIKMLIKIFTDLFSVAEIPNNMITAK